jgi:hypothetical protein
LADVSITAANVAKGTGAQTATGIAAATITAGQTLYRDTSTYRLNLADANASATTATVEGIALHNAVAGQPITYQGKGEMTIGGTLVAGKVYVQSANAGGIAPAADLDTGHRCTVLGVAKSTSILDVRIFNSGHAV